MNAMVSARVPVEIKRQGDAKLREMGSSVTELVNAAYGYVIKHGALPGQSEPDKLATAGERQVKTLAGSDAQAFSNLWRARAVLDAQGYDGTNFKELLGEAREGRYARLA